MRSEGVSRRRRGFPPKGGAGTRAEPRGGKGARDGGVRDKPAGRRCARGETVRASREDNFREPVPMLVRLDYESILSHSHNIGHRV
jgi:hypothetical protein